MSYEKCKERPTPESTHRCTRAKGHAGDHVDAKVGRYGWPRKEGEE